MTEFTKEEVAFLNQLFDFGWKSGAYKEEAIGLFAVALRNKINKKD